jgi:predicted nucleic acid-binding Zn ribbon protein
MEFEKRLSIHANHEQVSCPNGHAHPQRIYSAPRITFKGSGFYVTDSRKHGSTQSSS